jgi:hypothetical protein
VELVKGYFQSVAGFSQPEAIVQVSNTPQMWRFLGMGGGDPFYAVIAQKLES